MIHSCSLLSGRTYSIFDSDLGTSHFSAIPRIAPLLFNSDRNRDSFNLCFSFSSSCSSCSSYQTIKRRKMQENYVMASAPSMTPRVGIIMGSDSDYPVIKTAAEILQEFNVPYEMKIVSAHRNPERMFSYASSARERGLEIIIAGAGGAAHLPGMVAPFTTLPVIGVPVRSSAVDGLDSLLSIVQMPRGVPVATVAIDNSTNAGFLAVRILGISDFDLCARISQYLKDTQNDVLAKPDKLEKDDSSPHHFHTNGKSTKRVLKP